MADALEQLQRFDENNLPDLDTVVLGALEYCSEVTLPSFAIPYSHPIVVGSAGAFSVGQLLFADTDAVFADESSLESVVKRSINVDGAVVISASGSKHAVSVARFLQNHNINTTLITNNSDAPARQFVDEASVIVFPKNREPYTYNTSSYLSMILGRTREPAAEILSHTLEKVQPAIRSDLGSFTAFTFILPRSYGLMAPLIRIKFDEMFAPIVTGRAFTEEEIKHAKTVIRSDSECFISVGVENTDFGAEAQRMHVPLPSRANYGAVMAVCYYVIGGIQKHHPPYFKENIRTYVEQASKIFDVELHTIVE